MILENELNKCLRFDKTNALEDKYIKYINQLNMTYEKAYGNCEKVCRKMQRQFPELQLIRGHYYCIVWGERTHWWLQTECGDIIDPTAIQFPTNGSGVYEPWDETQEEPTGKCIQCGEYCYKGIYIHQECQEAFKKCL